VRSFAQESLDQRPAEFELAAPPDQSSGLTRTSRDISTEYDPDLGLLTLTLSFEYSDYQMPDKPWSGAGMDGSSRTRIHSRSSSRIPTVTATMSNSWLRV